MLKLIDIPPMLPEMANLSLACRYVALYYLDGKAYWDGGIAKQTLNFDSCWKILVTHPTIALQLTKDIDLGSDCSEASHHLMLDREEDNLYLCTVEESKNLIHSQQEVIAVLSVFPIELNPIAANTPTKLHRFEKGGDRICDRQREAIELNLWLDKQLTIGMIQQGLTNAKNDSFYARNALDRIEKCFGYA